MEFTKKAKIAIGIGVAALAWGGIAWYQEAHAADLGGNCCADLEERIAELEATTAKKGNRKVSLVVSGEINKTLRIIDTDPVTASLHINGTTVGSGEIAPGFKSEDVVDGSASPSLVRFEGSAQFEKDWKAGYVLEIGVGGFDDGGTNEIYINRSFVYLDGPVGKLSLGHASQASDDIDKITLANTGVAVRPLSLRPITGPQEGEILDLFDGTRADLVRYDTRPIAGFIASASWASGNDNGDGDVWDVALRWAGEGQGFKVAAGAAYRHGIVLNSGGGSFTLDEDVLDVDVYSAALSVMHVQSGLFLTGNYGSLEGDVLKALPFAVDLDGDGYALTGGLEQTFFALGRTTLFAEWGKTDVGLATTIPNFASIGADMEITYYGGGVVQAIDAAAMDIYATVRVYEIDAGLDVSNGVNSGGIDIETEAVVGTVGGRVKF
jgi:hypothetical protein